MILGIDVAFIHTPHRSLADWYAKQAILLSFKVDDIRREVEALAGRGVRFYPSAETVIFDVGPSLIATFIDPDGNWMQLSQRNVVTEGR